MTPDGRPSSRTDWRNGSEFRWRRAGNRLKDQRPDVAQERDDYKEAEEANQRPQPNLAYGLR